MLRGPERWLSAMVVSNGCQQWLSAMAVSNGCQQWLSAMVVSNGFPPKTAFFEGFVPNGRHHAPPGAEAIWMVKFSAQTELISGISDFGRVSGMLRGSAKACRFSIPGPGMLRRPCTSWRPGLRCSMQL